MTRRLAAAAIALTLTGCAGTAGYTALRIPAPKGPPLSQADANQWWQGSSARLGRNISFYKKPKKGWRVAVLELPREGHAVNTKNWQDLQMVFRLPDTEASRKVIDKDGVLYAGTAFHMNGWGVSELDGDPVNILRLQLANDTAPGDITVRCLQYRTLIIFKSSDCTLDGVLQRAEPYFRAHLFQLGPGAAPARAAAPAAAASQLSVTVLSASVTPLRVERGAEIQLVITYKIDGLPGSSTAAVMERRIVRKADAAIMDLPSAVTRASGTFTSRQTIRIPASAEPGAYSFTADVSVNGATGTGEALFEVR